MFLYLFTSICFIAFRAVFLFGWLEIAPNLAHGKPFFNAPVNLRRRWNRMPAKPVGARQVEAGC